MGPLLLDNTIREYAWGSTETLPALLGVEPNGQPQAELWMGAHPGAPSKVLPDGIGLDAWISRDPTAALGEAVASQFDNRLPFLFKVLAAAKPLSIQVHPNLDQARAGFSREDAAGVALDARERTYRDRNHKPELVCALEPFEALCGWRPVAATRRLFAALEIAPVVATLAAPDPSDAIASTVRAALTAPAEQRAALAHSIGQACATAAVEPMFQGAVQWGARLAQAYPGDAGIVVALMLNHLTLQPGEALYLGAGRPHAYLRGTAVELMANSDNVIRGGLTPKHVDVEELLKIVDTQPETVTPLRATEVAPGRFRYAAPAPEFNLERIRSEAGEVSIEELRGPEILLCSEGEVRVHVEGSPEIAITQGRSAFIPANVQRYTVRGSGTAFRAQVGDA